MNLITKKKIAREILVLFSTFLIGGIGLLGSYTYTSIIEQSINSYQSALIPLNKKIESLQKVFDLLNEQDQAKIKEAKKRSNEFVEEIIRLRKKQDIITNKPILLLYFFCVSFVIFFPIRYAIYYLYILIKWCIKTLKQKG